MSNAIYQAITNAMGEITPIAKDKQNIQQKFKYRGVDDVMNCLSPILTKHKIFIYPEVINKEREERKSNSGGNLIYSILTIKYHFATDDGSEICVTVIGEGMDSGDKASNKAMAVAFKYACFQVFCIPTEDMDDTDQITPPPSMPKNGENKKPENKNVPHIDMAEKERLGKLIGEILETKDADEHPYFRDQEITNERKVFMSAQTMDAIQKQYERLAGYLEKRKGNEHPKFQDDIPF